ncbi:MAG: acyl-CoA thioesterase [Leptospira sp.]|nr:acyl-CoA thioesterase [Leptospira sp.]
MQEKINKKDFGFSFSLRVRYSEADSQGIVFNANYLIYFDIAVTEYFRGMGIAYSEFVNRHSMDFHVIRSVIDYKTPARFDDELRIFIRGEYSGVKIFWSIAIFRQDELICSGELIYAAVDTKTGRLKKIDNSIATDISLTGKKSE